MLYVLGVPFSVIMNPQHCNTGKTKQYCITVIYHVHIQECVSRKCILKNDLVNNHLNKVGFINHYRKSTTYLTPENANIYFSYSFFFKTSKISCPLVPKYFYLCLCILFGKLRLLDTAYEVINKSVHK